MLYVMTFWMMYIQDNTCIYLLLNCGVGTGIYCLALLSEANSRKPSKSCFHAISAVKLNEPLTLFTTLDLCVTDVHCLLKARGWRQFCPDFDSWSRCDALAEGKTNNFMCTCADGPV